MNILRLNSKGVYWSNSVNSSEGISDSDGINSSRGVEWSKGVSSSDGVKFSWGVNSSEGVSSSNGVNCSHAVNWSHGVNFSRGVNLSYGVLNCYGVDKAIFPKVKKREYTIFGIVVSEKRYHDVWETLHVKLDGWFPKFNNAFELYIKKDNNWAKVNAREITGTLEDNTQPYEAWKDMPQAAVDYLISLPEFDAENFKRVTGIDTNKLVN